MLFKVVAVAPHILEHPTECASVSEPIEAENSRGLELKFIENIGFGVFATKEYLPGDLVVRGIQLRDAQKSIHSITGPDGREYIYNQFAETINHNCDPNTGPYSKQGEPWNWYARTAIKPGQEINWAYDWTEPVIGHFNLGSSVKSQCLCGSSACRSPLNGFEALSQTQRDEISRQKSDLERAIILRLSQQFSGKNLAEEKVNPISK